MYWLSTPSNYILNSPDLHVDLFIMIRSDWLLESLTFDSSRFAFANSNPIDQDKCADSNHRYT